MNKAPPPMVIAASMGQRLAASPLHTQLTGQLRLQPGGGAHHPHAHALHVPRPPLHSLQHHVHPPTRESSVSSRARPLALRAGVE